MKKMREDSIWNQLTGEQRDLVDYWLFEERLPYTKITEKIEKEFGKSVSIPSLGRYFQRRARERMVGDMMSSISAAAALENVPVKKEFLCEAAMKLVGQTALKMATEHPHAIMDLNRVTRLLLAGRNTDVRERRLELAQRRFDYEAMAAAHEELPRLRAYMNAIAENPDLTDEQRADLYQGIIFGWDPEKRKTGEAWMRAVQQRVEKGNDPQKDAPPPGPPPLDDSGNDLPNPS